MDIRAQSAMEYLMTYGWTILIIGVVLSIVFSLGLFNRGPNSVSTSCLPKAGYICNSPLLLSNGILSASVGSPFYNLASVQTSCVTGNAAPTSWTATQGSINAGTPISLYFSCPIGANDIGSSFAGTLWIKYISSGQTISAAIGTVSAKVSAGGISGPITYSHSSSTGSGLSFFTTVSTGNLYFCAAVPVSGLTTDSWGTSDITFANGGIGHQFSSNVCSGTQPGGASYSISGLEVANVAAYSLLNSGVVGGPSYTMTYSVGDLGQYTFMMMEEIGPTIASISAPTSGSCSLVENAVSTGYTAIYVCSGQTPGPYSVAVTASAPSSGAWAAYGVG